MADVASHEEGGRSHNEVKHLTRQYGHQWVLPAQGPNVEHETLSNQGQFGPVRGKEHHTLLCEYTSYDLQGNGDMQNYSYLNNSKNFSNIVQSKSFFIQIFASKIN